LGEDVQSGRTIAALVLGGFFFACGAPAPGGPDYELSSNQTGAPGGGGSGYDPPPPGSDDTNNDNSSSSGSAADAGTDAPAAAKDASHDATPSPKPTSVTVTIDGTTMHVDGTTLWSDVSAKGTYDLFVKVSGTGVPSGSDFVISATKTAKGCDNTANYITYRPSGDTQYMPASPVEPACGLSISALPPAVGARFTGSFKGTLDAINVSSPRSKTFSLTFDVVRTE
jgi:hypothetical protein